jgi:hypothetical protein
MLETNCRSHCQCRLAGPSESVVREIERRFHEPSPTLPCRSSRTAIPRVPTCRRRGRVGDVSWPRCPTDWKGNCSVPAVVRGPLMIRCIASQSSGSACRTVISPRLFLCCLRGQSNTGQRGPRHAAGARVETLHVTSLRGARLLFRGGVLDLPLDIGDAGEGADVDLVVRALDALLALALGPAAAHQRAQVAAQEA